MSSFHISLRRSSGLRASFLCIGFVGFMMTDCTPSGSANFPVACHMTGCSADDCALDATLGLGGGRKHESENGGAN
jgi:hypothetical protein